MEEASYSLEAFVRTVLYVPALFLVGCVAFRFRYPEKATHRLIRFALVASGVLIVAVLLRAVAYSYTAFGEEALRWESLRLVALESRWGARWRWQLMGAFALMLSLTVSLVRARAGWALAAVAALGLCASLPLTGHAMALGAPAVLVQAAHVLGAGTWIGTLSVLVLFAVDDASYRRFAPLATAGVTLLLSSGVVTAWHVLPSVASIGQSGYGRLLATKVAAVALVLLCGLLNWRHFRSGSPGRSWVSGELVMAAVVLALTGWLSETGTP